VTFIPGRRADTYRGMHHRKLSSLETKTKIMKKNKNTNKKKKKKQKKKKKKTTTMMIISVPATFKPSVKTSHYKPSPLTFYHLRDYIYLGLKSNGNNKRECTCSEY